MHIVQMQEVGPIRRGARDLKGLLYNLAGSWHVTDAEIDLARVSSHMLETL